MVSPSASPRSVVTEMPTSSSARASMHRPEVEIAGRPTRMLVEQIRSIDTDHLVGDPVDHHSRDRLGEVELAPAHDLGIGSLTPPETRWPR